MGYTPAFSDIYMGTLFGRWPAAAVWATLLPLMDRHGCIDMSMQAIAGMTGWPIDLLELGIKQLMDTDPGSRSPDSDGRRLVSIDSTRPWGWRAVNHGKYREKARKQSFDAERTASGKDAERKRMSRDVPTRPALTRVDPLSDSDSDIDTDKEEEKRARKTRPASHLPADFVLTIGRIAVAQKLGVDPDAAFAKFTDYWRAAGGQKARKRDWDAAWSFWCRSELKPKASVIDADQKDRAQIIGLAELFGMEQGSDEWLVFASKVHAKNNQRLESIGR